MDDTEDGCAAEGPQRGARMHEERVREDTSARVERCTAMAPDAAQASGAEAGRRLASQGQSESSPLHAKPLAWSLPCDHDEQPNTPAARQEIKSGSAAGEVTSPARAVSDPRETSPGSEGSPACMAGGENPFTTPSQPAPALAAGTRRPRQSRSPSQHRRFRGAAAIVGDQGSGMVGEAHPPSSSISLHTPWHASQAALLAQEQQFARTAAWLSSTCHLDSMPCADPNQSSAGRQASWPADVAEQHLIGVANIADTSFPQGAQLQQLQQQQVVVVAPAAPAPQLTYLGEVQQEQLVHAYQSQAGVLHMSPRYTGALVWPGQDSGVGFVHPEQQQQQQQVQQVRDMQRQFSWPHAPRLQTRTPSMPALAACPSLPYPPAIGGPPADAWAQQPPLPPPPPPPPLQRCVTGLSGPSLGTWGAAAEHLHPSLRSMSLALRNFPAAAPAQAPPPLPPQQPAGLPAGGWTAFADMRVELRSASRAGSMRRPGWATPPQQQLQQQQEQLLELQHQQGVCMGELQQQQALAREEVADLEHELRDSHAAERDSLRTIGALSARLDATLERETSLRQRLAHVEVALTAQHGDVIPGTAAPGEGLHGDGGMLAARQRIAMLEASLQACYQQLEAARSKAGSVCSPSTPLDSAASPAQLAAGGQGSAEAAAAAFGLCAGQPRQAQAAALHRERCATAAAQEQAADAQERVVQLEQDLGHVGRRLEAVAAEGRASDAAAARLKQERAEAVGRAERADSGAAHARELAQAAAGSEQAAQRAAASAEADAAALRRELGTARKALWEREGEVARLQASLASARAELEDMRERFRRLERASARAEAHAEPAGLRCGPSKDRSGGVPYAGPSKDRSGGASYSARERKPTMPATPAQAPPQIGTTPPHPPTYIGEVVPAPVPARASEDGPSLRSAFAASAHFPRAHSASGPLADAGQLPAPGGGQAGAGTQGSRGAWSIGESTGRSSFDSQELSAWRPSQDSGGAQHGADAGRPLVSEAALQDLMQHSAKLEERLLQLSLEEAALRSEAARTPPARTAAERLRRAQVQHRLDGIGGEAGSVRLQLKRLGVK